MKFRLIEQPDGSWFWELCGGNGRVLGISKWSYASYDAVLKSATRVIKGLALQKSIPWEVVKLPERKLKRTEEEKESNLDWLFTVQYNHAEE